MGLGYIGLPTAAVLARDGHDVVGVDVRSGVVDTINLGEIHIHEPGLGELVSETVESGHLRASLQPEEAGGLLVGRLRQPSPTKRVPRRSSSWRRARRD